MTVLVKGVQGARGQVRKYENSKLIIDFRQIEPTKSVTLFLFCVDYFFENFFFLSKKWQTKNQKWQTKNQKWRGEFFSSAKMVVSFRFQLVCSLYKCEAHKWGGVGYFLMFFKKWYETISLVNLFFLLIFLTKRFFVIFLSRRSKHLDHIFPFFMKSTSENKFYRFRIQNVKVYSKCNKQRV